MKKYLYSAIYTLHSLNQGAQTWIAQFYLQITPRVPFHTITWW